VQEKESKQRENGGEQRKKAKKKQRYKYERKLRENSSKDMRKS
jgi:hypothetical protein